MTLGANFCSSLMGGPNLKNATDMADRVVLTDKLIKGLRPGDKRYDVVDALVPGLLASVNPGGTVTMMLRTRIGAKSPIRRAIGQYGRVTVEQARRTAREWLELLYKGSNPQEVRRRAQEEERKAREAAEAAASNTFTAVFDKFCVHKLKAQRRGFVVERIIQNELCICGASGPWAEISHRDCARRSSGWSSAAPRPMPKRSRCRPRVVQFRGRARPDRT